MTSPSVAFAGPTTRRARAVAAIAPERPGATRAFTYGLLLLLWAVSVAGSITEVLTMSRKQAAEGVQTVYTQAVVDAGHIAFLVPAVTAVLILVFRVVYVRNDVAPLVVLLLPWFWVIVNTFVRGGDVTAQMVLPIGVAVTLWAVQARVADLKLYALLAALLAAVSMALVSVAPSLMYMPQSFDAATDKTITGLPLLAGFFTHPNGNGLFLVLALPFTHLFERWYLRWASAGVLVVAIVWTSSRTALFGVAVWLLVMLLDLILRRALDKALMALVVALFLAMVVVPLTTSDAEAYTGRGGIWEFNLAQLHGAQWISGLGSDWYVENYPMLKSALSSAASHGHNVFVSSAVTAGLVLVGLLALVTFSAARTARSLPRRERVASFAFLAVLIGVSITESTWRMEAPDTLFAAMALPLFVIATQSPLVSATPRRSGELSGEARAGTPGWREV